jgi:hypothetical protein
MSFPSFLGQKGTRPELFQAMKNAIPQISCQIFHTQTVRGPEEKEGNFGTKNLFHTQNVHKHRKEWK